MLKIKKYVGIRGNNFSLHRPSYCLKLYSQAHFVRGTYYILLYVGRTGCRHDVYVELTWPQVQQYAALSRRHKRTPVDRLRP